MRARTLIRWGVAGAVTTVLAPGCSSGEAPDVAQPGTTERAAPTTAATTVPAPSTTAQPTTTEAPDPTEDPDALLQAVNRTMAELESFTAQSELTASETEGGPELAGITLIGGEIEQTSYWSRATIRASGASGPFKLVIDSREAEGASWSRDPLTGVWKADTDEDDGGGSSDTADALESALDGALSLDDLTAEDGSEGYVLQGNLAGPADVDVELLVDRDELVVLEVKASGIEPRSEWENLVPAGGADLYVSSRTVVADHDALLAEVVAPPEGRATVPWTSPSYPFEVQVPAEWVEATPEELAEDLEGVTAAFVSEDLGLFIVEEDLTEVVGATTLEDYVDFGETVLTDQGFVVDDVVTTTTVQGVPATLIEASDESGFVKVKRLVMLHEGSIGLSVSIAGPKVPMEEQAELVDFLLNTVLVTG